MWCIRAQKDQDVHSPSIWIIKSFLYLPRIFRRAVAELGWLWFFGFFSLSLLLLSFRVYLVWQDSNPTRFLDPNTAAGSVNLDSFGRERNPRSSLNIHEFLATGHTKVVKVMSKTDECPLHRHIRQVTYPGPQCNSLFSS